MGGVSKVLEIARLSKLDKVQKSLIQSHLRGLEITIANSISSEGRYDHFDTSPYLY